MKRYGRKQTRSNFPKHDNCAICHPKTKSRRAIEKTRWKKMIEGILNETYSQNR